MVREQQGALTFNFVSSAFPILAESESTPNLQLSSEERDKEPESDELLVLQGVSCCGQMGEYSLARSHV